MKKVREMRDRLRVKVTDRCNMHCSFCHAEGARGARDMSVSAETERVFRELRSIFGCVHLTGGEPVLYPQLADFVEMLISLGYTVSLTTNGYFDKGPVLDTLMKMCSINFSLHSFDSTYLAKIVVDVNDYRKKAVDNILYFNNHTKVSVNAVINGDESQHIEDIIHFCINNNILLNLLRSLDGPHLTAEGLGLTALGFKPIEKRILYPSSNTRIVFRDATGHEIIFKELEQFLPDFWCSGCKLKGRCEEGFAFVRLEGDPVRVRMCLDRPSMSFDEFKERYYKNLEELYGNVR